MSKFYKKVIVRPPSNSYINCISSHPLKQTIDVETAKMQHESFCAILQKLGLELIKLKPLENHPDGCFVEDCAIIYGDIAVICRLGHESRKGEEREIERILRKYKKIEKISLRAILEGGNVLKTEKEIFVGISKRTSINAINQLRKIVRRKITPIKLKNVIHLEQICTYLGYNIMLIAKKYLGMLPFSGYEIIEVNPEETYAANCLAYKDFVIVPKGYNQTIRKIKKKGFKIIEFETSEFEKGNGGITCLALIF